MRSNLKRSLEFRISCFGCSSEVGSKTHNSKLETRNYSPVTRNSKRWSPRSGRWTAVVLAGFIAALSAEVQSKLPEELEYARYVNRMRAKIEGKAFSSLESVARDLRRTKSTFADGGRKLDGFYEGIGGVWDKNSSTQWEKLIDILKAWLKKSPGSITCHVALAHAYIGYAWQARGSGWPKDIKDEDRKLSVKRLSTAEGYLKKAERLPQRDPVIFRLRIKVAMGRGLPKSVAATYVDRSMRYDPSYFASFNAMAINLLPRWGGAKDAWIQFASRIARRTGRAEYYARIVREVISLPDYRRDADYFSSSKQRWSVLKKGFEEWIRRYPRSFLTKGAYAYCACEAKDIDVARTMLVQLTQLADKKKYDLWKYWETFKGCRELALTETDEKYAAIPAAELYGKARNHYFDEDFEWAIQTATRVVERYPKYWKAWELIGECHHQLGNADAALDAYRRALAVNPHNAKLKERVKKLTP